MLTFKDVTQIIEKVSEVGIKMVYTTLEETQEIIRKASMPAIQAQSVEAGLVGVEWHHDGRHAAIEHGDDSSVSEAFLVRKRQKLLHTLGGVVEKQF